jgi:hypothetical protein
MRLRWRTSARVSSRSAGSKGAHEDGLRAGNAAMTVDDLLTYYVETVMASKELAPRTINRNMWAISADRRAESVALWEGLWGKPTRVP